MQDFLEILKYILPSLVVGGTIYLIMKKYLDKQHATEVLKYKQEQNRNILPIQLQAYERMAMFCERISLDNLSYRLSGTNMDAKSLSNAMLIAVQQEYEHNLSQQVYISDKLWEIITAAKEQIQNIITTAANDPQGRTSAAALVNKAMELQNQLGGSPIRTAQKAIKKEIEIVL